MTERNLRVTRLSSNAKGGFDFELGTCTLIVGDNGWGKTGVKAALELALTGDSSDFGKRGMYIMEMVAPVTQFWSNAELSDGKALRFETTGSPSRATAPTWAVGGEPVGKSPAVILSDEVSALMNKKTDKALRTALMDITVGDIDPGVISQEIPDAFKSVWEPFWTTAVEDAETVADAILAARKAVDGWLKEIRVQKKVDLGERPAALSPGDLDALRQKVWGLKQKLELARVESTTPGEVRPSLVAPGMSVEGTEPVWYVPGGPPGREQFKPSKYVQEMRAAAESMKHSVKVLKLMADLSKDGAVPCLTCRRGEPMSAEQITSMISERELQAAKAHAAAQKADEIEFGLYQGRLKAVAAATPEIPPPAPPAQLSTPDLGPIEAELQDAERALGDALAARSAQEGWDRVSLQKRKAEGDEKVAKALRESVDAAIGGVLQGRVNTFEETATAYLPEGERLKIALVGDKGKTICRVGMEGGRHPEFRTWRAMCGAERARSVGAIAGAWGKGREEPVRIGMLDEVWLGTKALMDTCAGLRHAVYEGGLTMAIVFAVRADETPEGWTRVDLV